MLTASSSSLDQLDLPVVGPELALYRRDLGLEKAVQVLEHANLVQVGAAPGFEQGPLPLHERGNGWIFGAVGQHRPGT